MEVQQKVLWLPCVASGVVKTNMTPNRRAQEKVLSLPCVASGVMKTNNILRNNGNSDDKRSKAEAYTDTARRHETIRGDRDDNDNVRR